MAGKNPTYIDSAIYIAWIKGEDRGEGEIIHAILTNEITAVGSVIVRTEVMECDIPDDKRKLVAEVLSLPRLQLKAVTTRIADLAREIRDYYEAERRNGRKDLPKIETPDAIHLATAIYYNCPRLITLDGVKRNRKPSKLILLNGTIAGKYPLEICGPEEGQKAWSL
jgi:predicted nucleic acid-binding protein